MLLHPKTQLFSCTLLDRDQTSCHQCASLCCGPMHFSSPSPSACTVPKLFESTIARLVGRNTECACTTFQSLHGGATASSGNLSSQTFGVTGHRTFLFEGRAPSDLRVCGFVMVCVCSCDASAHSLPRVFVFFLSLCLVANDCYVENTLVLPTGRDAMVAAHQRRNAGRRVSVREPHSCDVTIWFGARVDTGYICNPAFRIFPVVFLFPLQSPTVQVQ